MTSVGWLYFSIFPELFPSKNNFFYWNVTMTIILVISISELIAYRKNSPRILIGALIVDIVFRVILMCIGRFVNLYAVLGLIFAFLALISAVLLLKYHSIPPSVEGKETQRE
jgi:hypothetical protein